jgi:hypothetical protein
LLGAIALDASQVAARKQTASAGSRDTLRGREIALTSGDDHRSVTTCTAFSACAACAACATGRRLAATDAAIVPNRHERTGIPGTANKSERSGHEKKGEKTHGSP